MPSKHLNRRNSARAKPDTDRAAFSRLNALPIKINVSGLACRLIYWGLNPANATDVNPHSHSFYEACYVFTGAGSVRIQNRSHPLSQGSLFLLRPNQIHRIRSSQSHPMGLVFWAFSLESEPGLLNDSPDLHTLAKAFILSTKTTAKPPQNSIQPLLSLITSEAQTRPPAPGFSFAVTALTRKLILETLRAFALFPAKNATSLATPQATAPPVARALRFIHDNFMRPITVGQIAQHVHLGERQLARLFLKEQSTSVAKYLANLRIEAAGRMLLAGGLSIKQIATRSGYPNVAYFTAVFKKTTRITPGEYRKKKGQVYPLRVKKNRLK